MQIRTRDLTRIWSFPSSLEMDLEVPSVVVTVVDRCDYESARRKLNCGELIVTRECTSNFAVADMIRVVSVQVKDVHIGKLHLRFYKDHGKVKRNFVADCSQVRKLLGRKRERLALHSVDWIGDTSEEDIRRLANDAVKEIENMCLKSPTVTIQSTQVGGKVAPVVLQVPGASKVERPVTLSNSQAVAQSPAAPQQGAVSREAVGESHIGVVVELGKTWRGNTNGGYPSFCLKLDIGGKHVPFYGVELERECAERGVRAGQTVEVIDMGKQQLSGNRHRNLYRINILRNK